MTKLQLWLTTHAIALGFGALVVFGLMRQVAAHADAKRMAEVAALTQTVARQRDTIAAEDQARVVAITEARHVADSVGTVATQLAHRVAVLPRPVLPTVTLTPSRDTVCLALVAWQAHLHADSLRDSVATELSLFVTQGIPAIRDQYEAVIRSDSLALAVRDRALASQTLLTATWEREAKANQPTVASRVLHLVALGAAGYVGFRVGRWAHP